MSNQTIIVCTPDEMLKMLDSGEITDDVPCLTLTQVFEVMCDYYGVNPHWQPNDIY